MPACPTCGQQCPDGAAFCGGCGGALDFTSPVSDALPAGSRLKGERYRIEAVLGRGGFGITYRGRDLQLDRDVAIKELFPEGCRRVGSTLQPARLTPADLRNMVERFLNEARTLGRFSDPAIVQVFDSLEAHATAYMVMGFISGRTLGDKLRTEGAMPETAALACIRRVAAALEKLHRVGVLHRDIKPDNIMLGRDGRVVLIDFGTAREFTQGATRSMTSMVTPGYAPLEQRGTQARFGPYTDVYSLGATLYHMLTGVIPADALDRSLGVDLKNPRRINENISKSVSDAILESLNMKAENRPQTVAALMSILDGRATGRQEVSGGPGLGSPSAWASQSPRSTTATINSKPLVAVDFHAMPPAFRHQSAPGNSQPLQAVLVAPRTSGYVDNFMLKDDAEDSSWPTHGAQVMSVLCSGMLLAVVWFSLAYIVPQFAASIADASRGEVQLPAMLRNLIQLSDWLNSGAWVWAVPLLGLATFVFGQKRSPFVLALVSVGMAAVLIWGLWMVGASIDVDTKVWSWRLSFVCAIISFGQIMCWKSLVR